MREKGHHLEAWMFDALMRACVKEGMHQEVVRLFDEMPGAKIEPDQRVYVVMIVALCKLCDANRPLLVLRKMDDVGFARWDFTYNSVVDVLVKEGRMEEALHLKDEMLAVGEKMCIVLATTLMHGYCLRREVMKALDIFEEAVRDSMDPKEKAKAETRDWLNNVEDFDEFSDVEELYSTLPMEKVEALEDMVSLAPSSLVKGAASISTTPVLSTKSSVATSPTQELVTVIYEYTVLFFPNHSIILADSWGTIFRLTFKCHVLLYSPSK
ncbi:hypothetical protein ABZP36_013572 [Zizania latifolia]